MIAWLLALALLVAACCAAGAQSAAPIDLTCAAVYAPTPSPRNVKAVAMLVDEVEKRSQVRLPVVHERPPDSATVITVGASAALRHVGVPDVPGAAALKPEGYLLRADGNRVLIAGVDDRGVLYGIGCLLRNLRIGRQRIELPAALRIMSSPRYPLRGHQLGYRPKTNSYDGWSVSMWEQYIRDLAVFGANAVELIPPRSDDAADSPLFPLPPMQMMVEMSRLLDEYGLDVWIWYPAMDPDYSRPEAVDRALADWTEVFKKLPRIDAVFVPGGDPGHTEPKYLMALLEKQAASVRTYHPRAQMWVSPQGFSAQWLDEFLGILQNQQPAWLTGVVYGPQVRVPLARLRELVPKRYPIRDYPDITHSIQCQYPVPDWDVAYALTEGREGINPRPIDESTIIHATQKNTIGFISYSEGCNDDVNKALWSALAWDPGADVTQVLREYSRYFIGDVCADSFAQGLLALERDWRGPLTSNAGVDATLRQFRAMERAATPQMKLNWRFQQALYRAYYDAYTRSRLVHEQELERQAMDALCQASTIGALPAVSQAESILEQARARPVSQDLRARVFELAEALFQSIRMQLSVPRYHAIAVDRGANLDSIDVPLNDIKWLQSRFAAIRAMKSEPERLKSIAEILNWTNPGPGGFYDDLGDASNSPHLVRTKSLAEDPGRHSSMRVGFADDGDRLAWARHAETLWDTPLEMRYSGLDPSAAYRIRAGYAGDSPEKPIRLVANDGTEIHGYMPKPVPIRPVEFDIPHSATAGGTLTLRWYGQPGVGRNGRGCQVSEVWLTRKGEQERG